MGTFFFRVFGNLFKKRIEIPPEKVVEEAKEKPIVIPKRVDLVPASGLLSSYKKKKNPSERWDISVFKEGAEITRDMFDGLIELNKAVSEQNGTLYITDLRRTWELQEKRRQDYLDKTKPAYAAAPGGSFHQAGRAVDFSTSELNFKDVPKENWLKKFWDIAKPLGFRPIIKIPDLKISECWHFDYPGKEWEAAYDYMDDYASDAIDYTLVAKCCILDVGQWNPKEDPYKVLEMYIQAQLIRLGHYSVGYVDGIIGNKAKAILGALMLNNLSLEEVAFRLSNK